MADGDTSFWDETPEVEPAEDGVVVATFGPNASRALVGRSLVYEEGSFAVADGEPVAVEQVLTLDHSGVLIWVSDEVREWTKSQAKDGSSRTTAGKQEGDVVAHFTALSEYQPGRALRYQDGKFLVDGLGGIAFARVADIDARRQLAWRSIQVRDWVRASKRSTKTTGLSGLPDLAVGVAVVVSVVGFLSGAVAGLSMFGLQSQAGGTVAELFYHDMGGFVIVVSALLSTLVGLGAMAVSSLKHD